MSWKNYSFIFSLNLAVLICAAVLQPVPGFMDAEYYYAGGLQLAQGKGFTEPFLWNFLDNPAGLPHASHTYWMPLASLLAAAGMKLAGRLDFSAARIGFLLLAALTAPLTAALHFRLVGGKRGAMLAGLLAVFSGYYLARQATTDTFAIVMVLGAGYFLLIPGSAPKTGPLRWLLLGAVVGAFHLSRADGILWIPVSFLAAFLAAGGAYRQRFLNPIYVLAGYVLVMGPWMLRNWVTFGSVFSPGGMQALWLTEYDQLFVYPASQLTFNHWWSAGIPQIFQTRWWAFGINLQRVIAEQGVIFLTPLIVLGLWRLRKDLRIVTGFWGWLLILAMMTLIFPFAGARGGLFHSAAAIQPLFWAVAPIGLDAFLQWGARKRNWDPRQAGKVFGLAMIALAVLFSAATFFENVIGPDPSQPLWTQSHRKYSSIEVQLQQLGALPEDMVMVKNPPGYYLASNRSGIVVPYGDEQTLVNVAVRYGVRFILLESEHPLGLQALYKYPETHPPELEYLRELDGTLIFGVRR